ncbi:hypothetical protein ACVIW2_007795 [Bradyrhizobium huanghuaihaiense]
MGGMGRVPPHPPSLRAKRSNPATSPSLRAQRSNPGSLRGKILDCFVASAPRNDEWRELPKGPSHPPSLRAQRSNPESLRGKILDCFVASAPRNDEWRELRKGPPHPPSCERSEAIQSPSAEGFWIASSQALLAMTSGESCGRGRHIPVIASAAKQSRVPPRRDSGLLRFARNDDVVRVSALRRARAPDAAQRHFGGTLQSRCPCETGVRGVWVPALRRNAHALQLVRDTGAMRPHAGCGVRISRGRISAATIASRQSAAKACSMVTKPPCS